MAAGNESRKRPSAVKEDLEPFTIGDATLWFADGNTVLIAGGVAFKVHLGVLVRHCSVFKDIFATPQPADAERYQDCPVVRLYDSPEDLTQFLITMYDGF